jgi:propane monooxygenase coupling protein
MSQAVGTQQQTFAFSRAPSNRCGVTLSASREGNAIADLMSKKPGVVVTKFPAMIRIDAERKLEFDMQEIAGALGLDDYSVYDFEVETSTHYGRQVRLDDRVILFANPEDAAEYLGFDLKEVTPVH